MAKIYNTKVIAKNKAVAFGSSSVEYRYKGFSSREFKKNFKLNDFDLVKQDLLNHFYIRKGEKLENPNFGSIIFDMLFEQFTPDVKEAIAKNVEEIINYDKRIRVNTITVDTTEQGIRIEAELIYLPFNLTDILVMEFDRKNNVNN